MWGRVLKNQNVTLVNIELQTRLTKWGAFFIIISSPFLIVSSQEPACLVCDARSQEALSGVTSRLAWVANAMLTATGALAERKFQSVGRLAAFLCGVAYHKKSTIV